jgi:hypothetical protein
MTTRQKVIEIVERECRKLRDSRKMYEPFGTHTVRECLAKEGSVKPPDNFIEFQQWLRDLRLKPTWLRLHHEGCMIAGFTRVKRKPQTIPYRVRQ